MLSKDLKRIYEEYLPRYELQIKSFNPKELKRLILKASWEAENSYEKLAEPKTCDLDTYIGQLFFNLSVRATRRTHEKNL